MVTEYQKGVRLGKQDAVADRAAAIGTQWSEQFVNGYWYGWTKMREDLARYGNYRDGPENF